MSVVLVTGSNGLVGSEAAGFFSDRGLTVVGIDNNLRQAFFGKDASVIWNRKRLNKRYKNYTHYSVDIRDESRVSRIFKRYASDIALVIHCAGQPSHDWAARDPKTDFAVNAGGTLVLLEAVRKFCPQAVFIFSSTDKVYGDRPNYLPLIELEKRYDLSAQHLYYKGVDESMSVDSCLHSLFGVSKLAADLMVQEYGRYFGMKAGIFRAGCVTGPLHSGVELHGFLSYLVRCAVTGRKYTIYGYKGKQVRDHIHSYDLVNAFEHFFKAPRCAEVYNIGGGRSASLSVLEAITLCEKVSGRKIDHTYTDKTRIGDHIWWVSDITKFKSHYPGWDYKYGIEETVKEIYATQKESD